MNIVKMNLNNYKKIFKEFDVKVIDNGEYAIYIDYKGANVLKINEMILHGVGGIYINKTTQPIYNKVINLIFKNAKYFHSFIIIDYHKRIKIKGFIPMD